MHLQAVCISSCLFTVCNHVGMPVDFSNDFLGTLAIGPPQKYALPQKVPSPKSLKPYGHQVRGIVLVFCLRPLWWASLLLHFTLALGATIYYLRRRSPAPPFPPDHRQARGRGTAGERGAITWVARTKPTPLDDPKGRSRLVRASLYLSIYIQPAEEHRYGNQPRNIDMSQPMSFRRVLQVST